MNIQAVLVVTSRNNKLDKTFLIAAGNEIKDSISKEFENSINFFLKDKDSINKFNKNALINDEKYYYGLNLNEYDYLDDLNNIISSDWTKLNILNLVNTKRKGLEIKDNFRIFIIKDEEHIYFTFLTSKFLIRKKTIFDFSYKNDNTSLKSKNIGYVENGIMLPNDFNSVYDIKNKKLYVVNPDLFEKMIYIHEKNKAIAEKVFEKFQKSNYKLSKEKYSVKFDNPNQIKSRILESSRDSSRLAKYDQSEQFGIERIKLAVGKLNNEQKLKFDDEKKLIDVNEQNYKTFVAVIHDSIVERIISGDIEVLK